MNGYAPEYVSLGFSRKYLSLYASFKTPLNNEK